ncbi:hypothetical protein N9K75_01425, partial [bacterium]|nr:hypothetical protein [bacterium]
MKLSKNRLHKIKLKRNASRKKYNLRKKKGKYENSQKKHRRNPHLKRKTMKVYVGGGVGASKILPENFEDMGDISSEKSIEDSIKRLNTEIGAHNQLKATTIRKEYERQEKM